MRKVSYLVGKRAATVAVAFAIATILLVMARSKAASAQAPQEPRRPNIILYLADDIGREGFGAYGGTSYQTPNIDKLAAEGMRFERAYTTALCTPTRHELLTGQYNFRNYDDFGYLDTAQRTIANYLQAAGYVTAIAGKWQLGGGLQTPHHFGFDEYLLWQLENPDYYGRFKNPILTRNGEPARYHPGKYGPDMVSDFVLDFVERHRAEPFFVFYSELLPHAPFQPAPDHPDYASYDERNNGDPKYFANMVGHVDKNVGKLLAKLDALGIREQTFVIFMGDNGTARSITSMMNGRPVRGDKAGRLDAAIHVPFIANWKGTIAPGQVREDLVEALDVFPTIFEAGGVTIANLRKDGFSLYPTLLKGTPSPRQWIFTDFYFQRTPGPGTVRGDGGIGDPPVQYVHDTRFKLYANGQLFDYVADPLEQRPLSESALSAEARSAYQTLRGVLTRMDAEVERWDSRRLDEPLQMAPANLRTHDLAGRPATTVRGAGAGGRGRGTDAGGRGTAPGRGGQ